MSTEPTNPRPRLGWALALVASGVVAGGIVSATLPAGAQTTPSPSTTAPGATHRQRDGETLLTGSNAAKAKAAALKAVPGATVERVETDADGDAYEAHIVKPDGTRAVVKLDKDFKVTGIETCGPGGHGGSSGTTGTTSSTSANA